MSDIIEVSGLTKTFGQTVAVDDISFSVREGGLAVVLFGVAVAFFKFE